MRWCTWGGGWGRQQGEHGFKVTEWLVRCPSCCEAQLAAACWYKPKLQRIQRHQKKQHPPGPHPQQQTLAAEHRAAAQPWQSLHPEVEQLRAGQVPAVPSDTPARGQHGGLMARVEMEQHGTRQCQSERSTAAAAPTALWGASCDPPLPLPSAIFPAFPALPATRAHPARHAAAAAAQAACS